MAFVAFLCPLFLYQNAAVLYLNVDVAIFFCYKENWDQPKKNGDFRWLSEKSPYHKRGCFFGTLTKILVSPKNSYRWTDQDCGCSQLSVGLDRLNVAGPRYPIDSRKQ